MEFHLISLDSNQRQLLSKRRLSGERETFQP
jgi:hypothetical protein